MGHRSILNRVVLYHFIVHVFMLKRVRLYHFWLYSCPRWQVIYCSTFDCTRVCVDVFHTAPILIEHVSKLWGVLLYEFSLITFWRGSVTWVFTVWRCHFFILTGRYMRWCFTAHALGCSVHYVLHTYCILQQGTCSETPTNDCAKCIINDLPNVHYSGTRKLELHWTGRALICPVQGLSWGL